MELSPAERRNGKLSGERLQSALSALHDTGYVVLERALPDDWIKTIRAACDADLHVYLRKRANRKRFLDDNKGHVGMYPARRSPYLDPVAIANPFALQIMEAAMGPNVFCTFYNTNTAWPGCGTQQIHRDTRHLFPEVNVPLPVHTVVVNIPLVDFTLENGATEVWPGSHLILDRPEDQGTSLEERAAHLLSVRPVLPAGSLVVRDLRVWHRGMPNKTDTIRTMLAIVYFRAFLNRPEALTIPKDVWDGLPEGTRNILRYNRIKNRVGLEER